MEISIDDFSKVELKVGLIKSAERIEGTRLLKLIVDLGSEERQIISGIAEYYSPEQLIGKKVIVVANLKPKMIRGFESQGMILAAGCKEDEDKGIKPTLLTVDGDVPPGTRVC
ncbi:methionine--tRNA ligase subunit beta [Acidianus hospitalis]|jgi:tRNA-binding protein|uniref:Methionine--tRNA ligase n=2 Tax=Acidianus hospitalis TaxID=563177 RepID=A0A2T9X6D9_9CREN|nr:methionine--tRNA ligase subunit beta [Acidianus hospitalis]AEE94002.1 methionyl-tRNA synthetase, beta subunit [Acidianus hospitalis W1]MDT7900304.1 methionine--tRNA ligase subunit beta [Acidianus sp.]PVU75664.1 methionine--tRNA ligase subunit beta [Acidianus hospitalis]